MQVIKTAGIPSGYIIFRYRTAKYRWDRSREIYQRGIGGSGDGYCLYFWEKQLCHGTVSGTAIGFLDQAIGQK